MRDRAALHQETTEFSHYIWNQSQVHGRPHLPWRQTSDPYAITVSEIMLQQTQVTRVLEKYSSWLKAFPTIDTLADAQPTAVLKLWQGLGYNRRALFLQRLAQIVCKRHDGTMPVTKNELEALPGIGPYTAAAIRVFAFNTAAIMIETNIRAVFIEYFFSEEEGIDDSQLLPLIEETMDWHQPRQWYWALMDVGAHLKKDRPNPSRRSRHHTLQSKFEGSNRQVRAAIVRAVLVRSRIAMHELKSALDVEATPDKISTALKSLIADKTLVLEDDQIKVNQ